MFWKYPHCSAVIILISHFVSDLKTKKNIKEHETCSFHCGWNLDSAFEKRCVQTHRFVNVTIITL